MKERTAVKYTAKDSLFTDLFRDPKYLLLLYQALHPEDTETTAEQIGNVTLKNILLDHCYNDLGFTVGNRLVILVEAQSSWSVNIVVRSMLYLAQTYQEYLANTAQNVYGSRRLALPEPELYVIYTGERKERPEELLLSREFFGGHAGALEVRVKLLYGGAKGDIIDQYITFSKVYNEQVRRLGRTKEAVLETIRICKDRDILREYLKKQESEVVDFMMMLFDEDYILKLYVEDEKREAAKKAAEEAAEKAAEKAAQDAANRMYQNGVSPENIAFFLAASLETVEEWLELAAK